MTDMKNWRDEFQFTMKPRQGKTAQGHHLLCGRSLNGLKVMENHAKNTCLKRKSVLA